MKSLVQDKKRKTYEKGILIYCPSCQIRLRLVERWINAENIEMFKVYCRKCQQFQIRPVVNPTNITKFIQLNGPMSEPELNTKFLNHTKWGIVGHYLRKMGSNQQIYRVKGKSNGISLYQLTPPEILPDYKIGNYLLTPLQHDIIQILKNNEPMTRADLVRNLDAPRTTIYDNLEGLMQHNIVQKYGRPTNSVGRPLIFFKLM